MNFIRHTSYMGVLVLVCPSHSADNHHFCYPTCTSRHNHAQHASTDTALVILCTIQCQCVLYAPLHENPLINMPSAGKFEDLRPSASRSLALS